MQPKRIIVMILVVILALCSAGTVVSAEDSTTLDMAVEVSSSTALSDNALFLLEEGALVTVSVTIKNNPGITLAHFEIKYNPDVLEPVMKSDNTTLNWTKGTVFAGATETVTVKETTGTSATGTVNYTAYNPGANVTATGFVFSCNFKVIAHGSSPVTFEMDSKDIMNKELDLFPEDTVKVTMNGAEGNTRTALVHRYPSTNTHVGATCLEPGKDVYVCTVCGNKTTIVSPDEPAKGHNEVEDIPSVAPTCKTPGKTVSTKCGDCGIAIQQQFDIPAGPQHHVEEIEPAIAPTCQEAGRTEGVACSVCLDVITASTVLPKLDDHVYGDWVDNGDGTHTKTCIHCEESVTEPVNALSTLLIALIVVGIVLTLVVIAGITVLVIFLVKRKKVV